MATALITLEAAGADTARRVARANAATTGTLNDRNRIDRDTVETLQKRLKNLKGSLEQRLLGGDGSLTDFRRFDLQARLADVDRLIAQATADLADLAKEQADRMADAGDAHAVEPVRAAQLHITRTLPGIDAAIVGATFDNVVDLLTPPMQQFATDVKVSLRRVTLTGTNRFEEIARLRDKISGAGFESAQFKAERIVRTEVGRAFSQANFAKMEQLAKDFPFLRKGWRATKDSRTRLGHVQAGQTYARGQGIPIAEHFKVPVYDERGKKQAPKLIGTASLLFPLDPNATPPGRVAAGATIMCRCNGFTDFNLAEFRDHTRQQLQLALGKPTPTPAPPQEPEQPMTDDQIAKAQTANYYGGVFYGTRAWADALAQQLGHGAGVVEFKRSGFTYYAVRRGGAMFGPNGWKADPLPKPRKPKVVKVPPPPTPAQLAGTPVPVKPAAAGPIGTTVSRALLVEGRTADLRKKVEDILKTIDQVHGDGTMPKIPFVLTNSSAGRYGAYRHYPRSAVDIQLTKNGMANSPHMTSWHEVGHFLDHVASGLSPAFLSAGRAFGMSTDLGDAIEGWRSAVKQSKAYETLANWKRGQGTPKGVHKDHLNYLLSTDEVWARSYAQYIAVRSGHPGGLAELSGMTGTVGAVSPTTPYNNTRAAGQTPGTWDYPKQWEPADFAPIAAAFDKLFEVMGWRSKP